MSVPLAPFHYFDFFQTLLVSSMPALPRGSEVVHVIICNDFLLFSYKNL